MESGEIYVQFFSVKNFIKPEQIVGEIPTNKETYQETTRVALPSMTESLLIALISAVDMIMVGGIGADAIASVGITNQPRFIIMALVLSLNVGVTVIVSRRIGEEKYENANRCLRQAIVISTVTSFILSLFGFVFARPIVSWAGATSEYVDMASIYFKSIMVGNFFYCISLTINAAQKGAGNTKIAMRTNISANALNLCLNYLLINGIWIFPKWGVMGAGIATSCGNILAFLMSFYSIMNTTTDDILRLQKEQSWKFDKKTIHDLYVISSSAFIEQIFMRIGFFLYSKTVASLGMVAFATHNVCMNIINLSFSVGEGLSVATSSLVGRSLGANRTDLAIIYSKVTQRLGNVSSLLLGIFMILFRIPLIRLFSNDPEIINAGTNIIFIIVLTLFFQIAQVVTSGCLRSAGDVKFIALLSLVSVTLIRPTLTYVLAFPLGLGLVGAWLSLFLDQLIRYFASIKRYNKAKWIDIKI